MTPAGLLTTQKNKSVYSNGTTHFPHLSFTSYCVLIFETPHLEIILVVRVGVNYEINVSVIQPRVITVAHRQRLTIHRI